MASVKFCSVCDNLLYPWADKVNPEVLLLKCRHCDHQEETTNPCVYKHTLIVAANETASSTQDLECDPTLPHSNIECVNCSVCFGGQSNRVTTSMVVFYKCTACHQTFTDPKLGH
ncbi:hypothetical protein JCM1840_005547 [Sporobolomyces johnsonii]